MQGLRQRPLTLWFGAACAAIALASACNKSPSLADQLSPSGSVSVTGLSLSFSTPSVGSAVQAIATATFSNGTTTPVASGFGTDAPGVATVTSSGGVTGVSIGDVTIFVDYQGLRASKRVRVLPGYSGTFLGSYTVAACTASGVFVSATPDEDLCTLFSTGRVLQIAAQYTQSADLTTVTGPFALGGLASTGGNGSVSESGVLSYSSSITIGTGRVELRNFTASSPSLGRIAGSFEMVWSDSAAEGTGIVTCTNMDMTRQGAALSPARTPLGRSLSLRSALQLISQR